MRLILVLIISFNLVDAQNLSNVTFGGLNSLDVITWNIENFPKNGQQTIDSRSLIDMIFEIADIKKNVEFRKKDVKTNQHYVNTPYRYTPKTSKKIVPKNFKDFGQGLLEVIEEVSNNEYRWRVY